MIYGMIFLPLGQVKRLWNLESCWVGSENGGTGTTIFHEKNMGVNPSCEMSQLTQLAQFQDA